RISGAGGPLAGRHDDLSFHDSDPFDEDRADTNHARPTLSPREAEVLALLAEGAPNKVIARRLNISVHTAKFHVAAILIKLGAANRTDAIAIAMRQGLVLV
ncbi:MAG: helix-turn-helix transcriptional regulator, partial [Mesorhizobium sp.]